MWTVCEDGRWGRTQEQADCDDYPTFRERVLDFYFPLISFSLWRKFTLVSSIAVYLYTFQINFWHGFWLVWSSSLFEERRTRKTFDWKAVSKNYQETASA